MDKHEPFFTPNFALELFFYQKNECDETTFFLGEAASFAGKVTVDYSTDIISWWCFFDGSNLFQSVSHIF